MYAAETDAACRMRTQRLVRIGSHIRSGRPLAGTSHLPRSFASPAVRNPLMENACEHQAGDCPAAAAHPGRSAVEVGKEAEGTDGAGAG